ncbi:uncharacterized protein LOC112492571 [Ziziphus jujuba]|uniref:Uncharacterized protein LOC112492571 n=1 Tax=Ziziphus jujuba TaxID=326968 RepID=A0A6P6GDU2_ZIZJJ|nr:uncharacterized protein LOC112492571 [Ziziphus jujuba]
MFARINIPNRVFGKISINSEESLGQRQRETEIREKEKLKSRGGGGMESVARPAEGKIGGGGGANGPYTRERCGHFQMPLHYPRYSRADYETMPEWKLDCLLNEYGLPITGDVHQKRKFAMGAFLWRY